MTGPLDKPAQPADAPVAWDPPTQVEPLPDPRNFAPHPRESPRDLAPPQPVAPTQPYPAPQQPYPPAPQHYSPYQGYPPPAYPMPGQPMVSVTQHNGMGPHTIVVRRGVNHGLHLVLTLITCGLWLPIWAIAIVIDLMNNN
ncbi:hypothetical protein [Nocardia lasii]|uniref:DUF4190 domain-containing protein n=1 Tax=Nocardia lasii TaxID=1616107 RepID=A0ABW1JW97_9NOCA